MTAVHGRITVPGARPCAPKCASKPNIDRHQRDASPDGHRGRKGATMQDAVGKDQLLGMMRSARAEWDGALALIPSEWMTEPGVEGEWSVKDIVAHIAWGERESAGAARARALVGSDLWGLPEDERNRAVFERYRHRALDDVLAGSSDAFAALITAIEALTEDDLNDPDRFDGMPAGWRPWRILYDPGHYAAHLRSIRAWARRRALNAKR